MAKPTEKILLSSFLRAASTLAAVFALMSLTIGLPTPAVSGGTGWCTDYDGNNFPCYDESATEWMFTLCPWVVMDQQTAAIQRIAHGQHMWSKYNGLYFIGEAVDVTGHLGGFNFQWAWASGHACGQAV